MKQYAAELFGTFWLVLGGCGSAVLAAVFPEVGIGLLGVSLAFGLTVLTMAYAIGHISGCHLNPAVSVGLWAGGRFEGSQLLPYIIAQVVGGVLAGGVLYLIASGQAGFDVSAGFASNGYGEHSPGGYTMTAALVAEIVMTAFFLIVIMGATDKRAPAGMAPIAIGLCLTLIHLITIPVTNTSVNPARSTGVALYVGDWAVGQLWLFWVAPIIGAVIGAAIYKFIGSGDWTNVMPGVEGRVALVTGGGRGIGRSTAELLAARGAQVMCVARSEAELAEVGLDYCVADLSAETGCAYAIGETEQRLGPIDIIVCNHGIGSAHEKVVWESSPEVWEETMRINLDGPFHLSRLTMGGMKERGYGRIVFTSSTAALIAESAGCAYNASKAGLLGLMRSVATDGGPFGITANAVLPGWVRTAMAERSARFEAEERGITPAEVWDERDALYPAGRVATPEEVAEMIAFLASEESSGVSGESVRVALGGMF